jgi:hypothetical protein
MTADFSEIQNFVYQSLVDFLSSEISLLKNNVSERTISQNFSNYLKTRFIDFDVDCEYNRHGSNIKTITYPNETKPSPIYPDIVIHSRGSDTKNIVVIEIKKYGNSEIENDEIKLKKLTSKDFRYALGLLIIFHMKNNFHLKPCLRWFSEGKEIM